MRIAVLVVTVAVALALAGCLQGLSEIPTDAVGEAHLQDGAVSEDKLQDDAVTGEKIGVDCREGELIQMQSGNWTCASARTGGGGGGAAGTTLADLSCGAGEVAKYDGSDWTCGADETGSGGGGGGSTSGAWALGGNSGLDADTDWLGTTDETNLVLQVNGETGFVLEPTAAEPQVRLGADSNKAPDDVEGVAIGGGFNNQVSRQYGTVGGGGNNRVTGQLGTVGGGTANEVSATTATVAGGDSNAAIGESAAVGGGEDNEAGGKGATVAGGLQNFATGDETTTEPITGTERYFGPATVGGGASNDASEPEATVSGGMDNVAAGIGATVGGGDGNEARGAYATVPGGELNSAHGDHSFAAGAGANATHDRTFVWSSTLDSFESGGNNLFLVDAPGVGLGTADPSTQLEVEDQVSGRADVSNHVAFIQNEASDGGDVLALETGADTAGSPENFITFYANGDAVGAIEGDGNGGITQKSGSGDFAEYLPKADTASGLEPGDVVGLVDGKLTHATAQASQVFVVSRNPILLGNDPGTYADDSDGGPVLEDHAAVAFVGQVETKVAGPVEAGDLLVPNGEADGVAVAVGAADATDRERRLAVGQALEDKPGDGEGTVNVLVSPPDPTHAVDDEDESPAEAETAGTSTDGPHDVETASSSASAGLGLAEVVAASLGSSAATLAGGVALLRFRDG